MGLADIGVAIYLIAFIVVMVVICIVGHFRNFHGREDAYDIVSRE